MADKQVLDYRSSPPKSRASGKLKLTLVLLFVFGPAIAIVLMLIIFFLNRLPI